MKKTDMAQQSKAITDRQELMKTNGGHFKDLKQKAQNGQLARIAINAQTIAINARHIPMLFPVGSTGTPDVKSRAKAAVWQDWDGFTAAAKNTQDAATALLELTKDADKKGVTGVQVDQAWKALGGTCKDCHKKFRVPKKKN
jgi:cytochrome c556